MRGTFVENSMTIQIEIEGEAWHQGSSIPVKWSIEGSQESLPQFGLALALIDLRKVKKDDSKAIKIIKEIPYNPKVTHYEHNFQLESNASISDGTCSYSIVCGDLSQPLSLKRLDLTILPWPTIEEIIQLIENYKRFKMKSLKNKKNFLDAKFSVPSSKEYGAVEGLNILFARIDENDSLALNFQFKTKKLTYNGASVETTKAVINVDRTLSKGDYTLYGDSINQEKLLAIFDEVFTEVSQRTRL